MPTPKAGESRQDFASRCIPTVINEKAGTTKEQASGKCFGIYDSWKKKQASHKKKKTKANANPDKTAIEILNSIKQSLEQLIDIRYKSLYKDEIMKARVVDGFGSPEPGNLPEKGKKMLTETYASCRKDGGDKEKSLKIAWGAVKRAGFKNE